MNLSGGEPPFLTCNLINLSGANEVDLLMLCTWSDVDEVEW